MIVQLAMNRWNEAVLDHFGLPRFVRNGSETPFATEIVTLNWGPTNGTSGAIRYCGSTTKARPATIQVFRAYGTAGCGGTAEDSADFTHVATDDTTLIDLLAHELGHAIGQNG
ncbi:MAG: hypothetical protein AB7I33_06115, partial [Gemmatimonadales bacterium]